MTMLRMTKRKLIMDLVPVPASLPLSAQIAGLLEVAHDRGHRSFGNTDGSRYVPQTDGRVGRDALEDVSVVRHEPPKMISFSRP